MDAVVLMYAFKAKSDHFRWYPLGCTNHNILRGIYNGTKVRIWHNFARTNLSWFVSDEFFFTSSSHNYYTSAICPYSLMDVDEVFTGTFKHKEDGFWKEKTNPGHINEVCDGYLCDFLVKRIWPKKSTVKTCLKLASSGYIEGFIAS